MKKIIYKTPEVVLIELNLEGAVLQTSSQTSIDSPSIDNIPSEDTSSLWN